MGCSHCMEGSLPNTGMHMPVETFLKAIDLTVRLEGYGWRNGVVPKILLTGGEPTDHPQFEDILDWTLGCGFETWVLTHGLWLHDEERKRSILRPERKRMIVQVTNDPRHYPQRIPRLPNDPRVTDATMIDHLLPLGRGKMKAQRFPSKKAPSSFNFRSIVRNFRSVEQGIAYIRVQAMLGRGWGNCTPSITHEGKLVAGESRFCWQIGDVDSTADEVTRNVLAMGKCNRCGLEDNLSPEHRRAIGASSLYLPGER